MICDNEWNNSDVIVCFCCENIFIDKKFWVKYGFRDLYIVSVYFYIGNYGKIDFDGECMLIDLVMVFFFLLCEWGIVFVFLIFVIIWVNFCGWLVKIRLKFLV